MKVKRKEVYVRDSHLNSDAFTHYITKSKNREKGTKNTIKVSGTYSDMVKRKKVYVIFI